ncbi:MAG: hypothetical protein GKR89_30540 [Candidatus Latescibacteria bacterium]|nr:hypothetical protein [Candidatus Latescibacterota bacterium]
MLKKRKMPCKPMGNVGKIGRFVALWLVLAAGAVWGQDEFDFVEVSLDDPALGLAAQTELLPSTGQLHALVVFAQFADEADQGDEIPAYADQLFDPHRPGSFAHFYDAMSFGQLQVRGKVLPRRYTADFPARRYLAKEADQRGRYGQFVEEILLQVDADYDLGAFDNNGPDGVANSGDDDGIVDYVFVLVRKAPHGFLLRGATGVVGLDLDPDYESADTTPDGQLLRVGGGIARGAIMGSGDFALTAGVMMHEFGHSLLGRSADLYDLSYARGPEHDSAGIGRWGLMGWGVLGWSGGPGPNPMTPWSREQLGWIGPQNGQLVEIGRDTTDLVVAPLHQGGQVYKIPLESAEEDEEYLLLEQRVRSAPYDAYLPAEGLLVWHVHSGARGNSKEEKKQVDLICADGLYTDAGYPLGGQVDAVAGGDNLDFWAHDEAYRQDRGGNRGDATDVFDGVRFTHFSLDSNPSTERRQSPASTGLHIGPIRRRGETSVVDIALPRWSGRIDEKVRWRGDVLVDGDLTIGRKGTLLVYHTARVRFAARDRLGTGVDPERIELNVEGALRIIPDYAGDGSIQSPPVPFAALEPEGSWVGIILGEGGRHNLDQVEGGYQLLDTDFGLVNSAAELVEAGLGLATAVVAESADEPLEFALKPNYPNPFGAATTIPYALAAGGAVRLRLYNGLGQQVRTLVDEFREAGAHETHWDGRDDGGGEVAAGLYLAHLEIVEHFQARRKMMRLGAGFSSLAGIDSVLGGASGWQAVQPGLLQRPATQLGLSAGVEADQVGYSLGVLWVNLQATGVAGPFAEQVRRTADLLTVLGDEVRTEPIAEILMDLSELPGPERQNRLAALQPGLEELAGADGDAGLVHFHLGQWLQTLRAGVATAQALAKPLNEVVDPGAEGRVARQFHRLLQVQGARPAILVALDGLALALDAGPLQERQLVGLVDLLRPVDEGLLVR